MRQDRRGVCHYGVALAQDCYSNKSRRGMRGVNFLRSLSNSAMVSLENPCPFHVLVFVISTQHWPSG